MINLAENKIELTGFAGSDVELRTFDNDKKLAKVSIAVSDRFKNAAGTELRNTNWFNLLFWNTLADEAEEKIKKGVKFGIVGKLQVQQYEKDGIKRYSTEIVVNEIHVVGTKD